MDHGKSRSVIHACFCIAFQELVGGDLQPILHPNNVIGCQNQIKVSTAFGEARDFFMTSEAEFAPGNGFEWTIRFCHIHSVFELISYAGRINLDF